MVSKNFLLKQFQFRKSLQVNVLNVLLLHLCYSSIGTVFRKNRSDFFVSFFVPTFTNESATFPTNCFTVYMQTLKRFIFSIVKFYHEKSISKKFEQNIFGEYLSWNSKRSDLSDFVKHQQKSMICEYLQSCQKVKFHLEKYVRNTFWLCKSVEQPTKR